MDSRFTTVFDKLEDLLVAVDIEDVDDLQTLMMALLDRPVSVSEGWDDEEGVAALDVRIHGKELILGLLHPFPLSVVELARSSAELAEELGPYAEDTEAGGTPDLLSLSDDDLVIALRLALGQVRLFNMLDED